jgi:hypothetical protein
MRCMYTYGHVVIFFFCRLNCNVAFWIRKPGEILIYYLNCPYSNSISWPSPFRSPQHPPMHPKAYISRHTHSAWQKNNLWKISMRSTLCLILYTPHILFVASLVCFVKQMNAARKQTTRTHGSDIIFQNLYVQIFVKVFIKHEAGTGLHCGAWNFFVVIKKL